VTVQTKAAPAGELYKPPKGRKTLTENHWPSRSWGLGGRPITCPRKIQKITETVTYQEQISNGKAVAVDGGTAGHTMMSMGKSLREARRPTRSLATPKSTTGVKQGCVMSGFLFLLTVEWKEMVQLGGGQGCRARKG